MILIKNIVFKLFILFISFFIFDLSVIDSNSDMRVIYNLNNTEEEGYFKLYFRGINSRELDEILNDLDIKVLSFIVDDKKYYIDSVDKLVNEYVKDMSIDKRLYYEINGIKIDGLTTVSEVSKIIKLEKLNVIY